MSQTFEDVHRNLWLDILNELRRTMEPEIVDTWFTKFELILLSIDTAVIAVPEQNQAVICDKLHNKFVVDAIRRRISLDVKVFFRHYDSKPYDIDEFSYTRDIQDLTDREKGIAKKRQSKQALPKPDIYGMNDEPVKIPSKQEYTFENFVIGGSNKFACAACKAVAAKPATDYNPLFIYGPSGLGKTHLLYATIRAVCENHPDFRFVLVNGEDFTNQMIDSLETNSTAEFRAKFRNADMLLIDDIQFIAGKDSTQEEFFNTFNALYNEKKQIIMTSDRPPRDIPKLENRLLTRFEWGLIADIQPPDFELRTAIMKKKAELCGLKLPTDVLNYLGENLTSNVRQIEGAVRKICAMSMLNGLPITTELAETCIADLIDTTAKITISPERIIECVARKYSTTKEKILEKRREKGITKVRHIAIYLVREYTGMSYPQIGKIFGRDHSTVMSSIDVISNELRDNPQLDGELRELRKDISGQ